MKGLLIKDINLLKGQKQFWISIVVIMVVLLGGMDNTVFAVCYMAIVASMFALNTLSYDEMQNGLCFLFTLPISRKSYLREKYLFGAVLSVIAMLAAVLAGKVVCLVKHSEFAAEDALAAVIGGLVVSVIILAIALPLQVKFGMEKGRVALLAVYGLAFLLGGAALKFVPESMKEMFAQADKFLDAYPAAAALGGCGIGILCMILSYLTALRFMNKKQF